MQRMRLIELISYSILDFRQTMSCAARTKFEQNHLAETMAQRTAEIYQKLLAV